ncbi:MAG: SDR family oxidoreductase [Proteobacteria bacterium]|jgi:UDP-glucuronate decarboxylase|nr:SDR family oxidoreductase [Pseudomonadota bacterium]
MARIVITGGAGFIGSHLSDVLLAQGHEVIAIDNLFTGTKRNMTHLRDHANFEFMRHDVTEPVLIECDQLYHLACPASPVHYQYNPIKTIKTNVIGTINMLGVAKRTHARFLLASTSEIYGDPLEHPQVESYWGNVNPIGPRSCYDEGKRVAETLTINYREQGGVDTRIVRIFNTFGPRMLFNDGRVVSNFILQALKGDDITVYGEGLQTRSFCYVDDLVSGIVATMNRDGFSGPVNLGNPNEMTIVDLAKKVIALTSSSSKIVQRPLPKDDPTRRQPDISFAKSELGWTPKVDLETGLKKTIADFDERLRRGETVD